MPRRKMRKSHRKVIEAARPNSELNTSQTAAPPNKANSGNRQDESICVGDGVEVAVIENRRTEIYSNALGLGGGGGGTKNAFSTRSFMVARACAGFCHCFSASFIASAIGKRTSPLP